jgi:predicted DNA-binding transcriptional regulator YafY
VELPSAVQFARELGVKSAWTIRRLIQEMQDLYGLPIDYEYSWHGYYYTEAGRLESLGKELLSVALPPCAAGRND